MRVHEHGQSVVEFMLVLPFVLMLVMALAEFGFAFYSYVTINNATAEAARFAAVGRLPSSVCDTNSVQWRARQMSRGLIACGEIAVTYQDGASNQPARQTGVTVNVARTYTAVTPLPGLVTFVTGGAFPEDWQMSACSDSRLESDLPPAASGTYPAATADCGG